MHEILTLAGVGHAVDRAPEGAQFLKLFKYGKIDVVILGLIQLSKEQDSWYFYR